ncbi:MAG: exodeoxyribonuclease VII small subunit [Nitrospirota bacterium]|nr:exodeoxyribonuclease VII small subunit [Nitrospirota bacterium]
MTQKKAQFEPSVKRLEEIVRRLESGEQTLEDSLTLFEEGVGLSRECLDLLGKAEQRVEQLMKERGIVPLDASELGEDR